MRYLTVVIGALTLTSCGSLSDSPQLQITDSTDQSVDTLEVTDAENPSVMSLLEKNDSLACAIAETQANILDLVRPSYPSAYLQRRFMDGKYSGASLIDEEQWHEAKATYGDLDQIVMSSFNAQTKVMDCSAILNADNKLHFPIAYRLTPTADRTQVIYQAQWADKQYDPNLQLKTGLLKRLLDLQMNNSDRNESSFTSTQNQLIALWDSEDQACRGGSGTEAETLQACNNRDRTMVKLNATGICYGENDQLAYEMRMHNCGPNSIR